MTTSSKLWLGFGLPTGLLFLSVLLILLRVSAITQDAGGIANRAEQRSAAARNLEIGVGEYALSVHRYLRIPGPEARQAIAAQIAEVEQGATAYEQLAETQPQRLLASRFVNGWHDLKTAGEALFAAEGPVDLDRLTVFSRLREDLNNHLNEAVQPEAVRVLSDSRDAAVADATRLENFAFYLLVGGTLLALVSSALIGRAVLNTERSSAEQAERTRTTLASIGDAVITTDMAGCVDGMNAVAETLTGWSLQEAKGKPLERVFQIVHEETRQPVKNPAARALQEGVIVGLANHTVLIAKDGAELPIDDSAAPIRSKAGKIVGCVLVFRDVAERQRAEREVRDSAKFTRRVLDSLFSFVGVLTADGTLIELNRAPLEAAGIEAEDVVGKKFWDCYWWAYSAESQAKLQEAIQRAKDGELVRHDVQVRMAGGRLMWIDFQMVALCNDDGRVTHLIPSGFDITSRKEAEEALRNSERFQRLAIEAGGLGYWDWDLANGQVLWGPGAYAHYGRDTPTGPEALESIVQFIDPRDRDRVLQEAATATGVGAPYQVEFRVIWPDGSTHWLHAQGEVSEWGPDGEPIHMIGVNTDITARKEAEATLIESEKRFRNMADTVPAMLWVTDEYNRCTFLNREWFKYTGQSAEEALGLGWLDAVHPDDRDHSAAIFLTASQRRETFHIDQRLRTAAGDYRWVVDSGRPRFTADGTFLGYIGSVVDIHDRNQAMEALRESEQQGRLLLEVVQNSPDFIGVADLEGKPIFMNEAAKELVGMTDERLGEAQLVEYFAPSERELVRTEVLPTALRDGRWVGELHFRHFGTERSIPVLYDVFRVDDPETGAPTHFATITSDLSEQKQALEALRESEDRFRRVVNELPLLVWMHNREGKQEFVNRTFIEYFGVADGEMARDRWSDIVHPDDLPTYAEDFLNCVRDRRPFDGEVRVRRADGTWRWIQSWGRPRFGADNTYLGHIGVSKDITDRKRALESLKVADRQKDEFLATLAHELRNPLAPIRTGLELMKLKTGDPDSLEQIRATMERQTEQLVVLVDDLLDISRITRGKLELRRSRIRLRDVIQAAVESSRWLIDAGHHKLIVELPQESVFVDADPHRMAQVVSNLLNNAAKYTPEGGEIRVTTGIRDGDAVIVVRDNGIGIAPDVQEYIFDMFAQVKHPTKQTASGLGLGLTLVRSLLQLHGGTIEVHSGGVNQGSEFCVRLPTAGAPAADAGDAQTNSASSAAIVETGRRILVVDDNKAAREMLVMVLESMGYAVRAAADGVEALEAAEDFQPDAVLLDIGMPRMDGYEAARRIRQQNWGRAMRLIALTGWGQEADKRRTQEAGFDHHLVKPVKSADLRPVLDLPRRENA